MFFHAQKEVQIALFNNLNIKGNGAAWEFLPFPIFLRLTENTPPFLALCFYLLAKSEIAGRVL